MAEQLVYSCCSIVLFVCGLLGLAGDLSSSLCCELGDITSCWVGVVWSGGGVAAACLRWVACDWFRKLVFDGLRAAVRGVKLIVSYCCYSQSCCWWVVCELLVVLLVIVFGWFLASSWLFGCCCSLYSGLSEELVCCELNQCMDESCLCFACVLFHLESFQVLLVGWCIF